MVVCSSMFHLLSVAMHVSAVCFEIECNAGQSWWVGTRLHVAFFLLVQINLFLWLRLSQKASGFCSLATSLQ